MGFLPEQRRQIYLASTRIAMGAGKCKSVAWCGQNGAKAPNRYLEKRSVLDFSLYLALGGDVGESAISKSKIGDL